MAKTPSSKQPLEGMNRRTFVKHMGTTLLAAGSINLLGTLAAQAKKAETFEIDMVTGGQNYFDPVGLWIPKGATIKWVVKSGSHTVTAYHPDYFGKPLRIPKSAKPFDSGMLGAPGQTFEVTFDVEGVYDYFCLPHEALGMVGRIVVGEPKGGPGTQPLQPTVFPMAKQVFQKISPERIVKEKKITWKNH